jgi:tetratricopeptide (TPR) repeat protein
VFDEQGELRRVFRGAITETNLNGLLASFRDEGLSEGPLRFLAQAYFGSGEYERAVDYYEKLASLRPRRLNQVSFEWQQIRARDLAMAGQARRRLGNLTEAIADFQSALRILGDDGTVLIELGLAAAEVGNLGLAADSFERAVRARPESVPAWLGKARVHRQRGEVAAARQSYERVLQLDRDNTRALRELADLNRGL